MSGTVYLTCPTCGVLTMGRRSWDRLPIQRRHTLRSQSVFLRRGGLCRPCYIRAERAAEPKRTDTRRLTRAEVLTEWAHLVDSELSIAENCRRIAPRLGMQWRTLERAIERARRRQEIAA